MDVWVSEVLGYVFRHQALAAVGEVRTCPLGRVGSYLTMFGLEVTVTITHAMNNQFTKASTTFTVNASSTQGKSMVKRRQIGSAAEGYESRRAAWRQFCLCHYDSLVCG